MFTEKWMLEDILNRGDEVTDYYIKQLITTPHCGKYLMSDERFYDCLAEGCNCAYEKTREYFIKQSELKL